MVIRAFPYQIAFDVIPQIDVFLEDGHTREEMKMMLETHKNCEGVNVETKQPFTIDAVRRLLESAPGIAVLDNPEQLTYPTALTAAGGNQVFVGCVRRDATVGNGLNLWIVADNLRKGAALNAVQIAETLINMIVKSPSLARQ
jgi:aspartate-semialdehyde dehydrogenase